MSQRLIIAIGISGLMGIVLLVGLNVLAAVQRGPTASPGTGTRPTPSATLRSSAPPSSPPRTAAVATPATATPTRPSPSPAAAALEADQSAGTLSVTISAPNAVELTAPAVCEWAADQPLRVAQVVTVPDAALEVRGERISLQIRPAATQSPDTAPAALLIRRLAATNAAQRAAYGPTVANESVVEVQAAPDAASGTMTFEKVGTMADTVPPDQLPVRRTIYAQPLGNEDSARLIGGTISWQCQAAPADFSPTPSEPSAAPSSSSDPSALRAPTVSLVLGNARRRGTAGCLQAATSEDGQRTGGDECPSAWVAPADLPAVLEVRAGTRIGVSPQSGWRIGKWEIRASTVVDVEATLGRPRASVLLFRGEASDPVGSLGFRAPAAGTWIVRATLDTEGPGSATARTTYFFVLRTS